jgi:hypothetical protein
MATPSQAISQMATLAGSNRNDNCFFTLYNALISSSANQNLKARISTHEQFYSNNNTVINQGTYNNYFGTGKEGSLTISSSAQVSASLNNINNAFGDPVVKNFQSLTINNGILFSPLRACRGLIIYCTGNLTVNGTISMTGKGGGVGTKIAAPLGIATSTDSRYDLVDATLYFNNCSSSVAGGRGIPTHWNWAPSGSIWFSNYKIRVPLSGSVAGGSAGSPSGGTGGAGSAGIFCCGGGGGGGGAANFAGGAGGRGTIFAGGSGGTGGITGPTPAAGSISGFFEAASQVSAGAGGAGNPAGVAGAGTAGSIGAGGLIILIVRGNVTINGTISSNGSIGGSCAPTGGGGGGGSGGGRIIIIYGGTYSNVGSVVANGANGGTGGPVPNGGPAGAGGAGSITTRKVNI